MRPDRRTLGSGPLPFDGSRGGRPLGGNLSFNVSMTPTVSAIPHQNPSSVTLQVLAAEAAGLAAA